MACPFLSIIIPVYNIKNYIAFTLNSVVNQTFHDFEVICVDDGSIDESADILDKYGAADKRFKIIHKVNGGVSSARNLGLDHASGEWIVFVDGDDALREDGLEIIYNAIHDNPSVDIVAYGVKFVDSISNYDLLKQEKENLVDVTTCNPTVPFCALNHYTVWSSAFKLNMLQGLRFSNLKNGEDQLFYNHAVLKSQNYLEIKANLYYYLQRVGSAVNSAWSERKQEDLLNMNLQITENLIHSGRKIDKRWLRRWMGNLLTINKDVWKFPDAKLALYLSQQRATLKLALQLENIPIGMRIWAWIACYLNHPLLFRLVAGYPIELYHKIKNSR